MCVLFGFCNIEAYTLMNEWDKTQNDQVLKSGYFKVSMFWLFYLYGSIIIITSPVVSVGLVEHSSPCSEIIGMNH